MHPYDMMWKLFRLNKISNYQSIHSLFFMRKFPVILFGLMVIGGLISCKTTDVGPSDDAIFDSNKTDIQSYATSKGLSGTFTTSGIYYALTKPSSSTVVPTEGMEAEYSYILYALISGGTTITDRFIDSTYATKSNYLIIAPSQPASPTVQGLTIGLQQMHVGEQGVIMLPSYYGLGRSGSDNGLVPPNAPLRLNMTLKQVRTEDQQIDQYLTANKLTPTEVTPSGLRYIKTLDNPTGVQPTPTQRLTIKYNGRLLRSASAFDSTGTGTYTGVVSGFVPGFAEGLAKLKTGEKATIVFPSKIGYGASGTGPISPYAPLRFDIELISAQ